MNKEHKYSIIIPIHNAANTILKCVESILLQKASKLQILLIDDHSTDDSYKICNELQQKNLTKVFLYKSKEYGVSAARNLGLYYADGDIIGFCDADDFFEENALKIVEEIFEKHKDIDIVVGGICCAANKAELLFYRKYNCCKTCGVAEFQRKVICDERIMGSVCNKFYKKNIIGDNTFDKNLNICEDTYFNTCILDKNRSAKIFITPQIVYNCIENPKSITHSLDKLFDNEANLQYIYAIKKIINDFNLNFYTYFSARKIIFQMAVETWWTYHNQITDQQKKNLLVEIHKNLLFFLFDVKKTIRDIKIIVKLILLSNKRTPFIK